jgi:hypothetical protein
MFTFRQSLTAALVTCLPLLAGCAGTEVATSPPDTAPASSPTPAPPSLDGVPLAAGWPDPGSAEPGRGNGLAGPDRSVEPITVEVCGEPLPVTGYDDRLGATWTNPEDYRARELLAFGREGAAAAFLESLVAEWEACPRHDGGDGFTRVQSVRDLPAGDAAHALVSWTEYDGAPAVGLSVIEVVRAGDLVLVDVTSNEGSADAADAQVREQSRALTPVVEEICARAGAGC